MNDPTAVAMLAWIATVLALACLLGVIVRSVIRVRARLRAERVRSAFAEARNDLVLLTITGELAPESATFRMLYFLNTAVMRRDDQYDAMWPAFLQSLRAVNDETHVNPMRAESREWTPGVASAAIRACQAMEVMLVEHSLILRAVFRLTGGMLPYMAAVHSARRRSPRIQAVSDRIEDFETRHEPARMDVRRFQRLLIGESTQTHIHAC